MACKGCGNSQDPNRKWDRCVACASKLEAEVERLTTRNKRLMSDLNARGLLLKNVEDDCKKLLAQLASALAAWNRIKVRQCWTDDKHTDDMAVNGPIEFGVREGWMNIKVLNGALKCAAPPAAPSVPDTPQQRAADKALEPFSRNQTDCRICENHKFDCHVACNSDPTHPYKNFKKGTKPAPPRPDVSCPTCGHVLTGPNRQHSMYGHCWIQGCGCQPEWDDQNVPPIKIARAAWERIKEFQCWHDPKASMAELPDDRMYQHDLGCIVTLDDFFGTIPNTNNKIECSPEAVCPHCKQSIILTDDGLFVTHNKPGWTSKPIKDEIYIPTKCSGSRTKPEYQNEGGLSNDDKYVLDLVMKILDIPQRLWKPMHHNIRTKLLHARNRLINNIKLDVIDKPAHPSGNLVVGTKQIALKCAWCGVKLVPGLYHSCLKKPHKVEFDIAADMLCAKVLADNMESGKGILGLKKQDVAGVLDTIIKENKKQGIDSGFLETHGKDVVSYVFDNFHHAQDIEKQKGKDVDQDGKK